MTSASYRTVALFLEECPAGEGAAEHSGGGAGRDYTFHEWEMCRFKKPLTSPAPPEEDDDDEDEEDLPVSAPEHSTKEKPNMLQINGTTLRALF